MDLIEFLANLWDNHRGKIIGVLVALFFGIIVLSFGFWKTLFLLACILVGLFIGYHIDAKINIKETLGKFFNGGNY
ncbi:MAG: DUF2273 domain-containing protein [Clostridiales bacterium]|nr:DUF2273 domain-containing protein [Clostridiales bacterium]